MQVITATDLRTKSKDLFVALQEGKTVDIVKGSRIIGRIVPHKEVSKKRITASVLQNKIRALKFGPTAVDDIDRLYREAMVKKHGGYLY